MAMMYCGGVVTGQPVLKHMESGTARFTCKLVDTREKNGKTWTDEYALEAWGEDAEALAARVVEGATVTDCKGIPRAHAYMNAEGKAVGVLVVKVKAQNVEIVGVAARVPEPEADEDDPFANQ